MADEYDVFSDDDDDGVQPQFQRHHAQNASKSSKPLFDADGELVYTSYFHFSALSFLVDGSEQASARIADRTRVGTSVRRDADE